MKKLFLIATAALALGAAPAMADSTIKSFANPGELSVTGGLGVGFYWSGLGFSLVPGAELGLTQIKLSNQFPINIGVSGRGFYSSYSYDYIGYKDSYTFIGLGGYATAHWSPKFLGLEGDFWKHIDYYIGLGLGFTFASESGTYADWYKSYHGYSYTPPGGGFGINGYSGVGYYLNDNLSLFIEGASYTSYGVTILGATYKL